MEACRESGAAAERRELCLKLSKIMQRGDTIVAQMVGFGIERRLLAPDSKEARAIAERKHVLEWRVAAAAKFDDSAVALDEKRARACAARANARACRAKKTSALQYCDEHKMALEPPEEHP